MRIAYVIPKYPGQTHIFFWREMQALRSIGIDVDAVSTQPPAKAEVVHEWAAEAMKTTPYLFPVRATELLRAIGVIAAAGPVAWWRCASAIGGASGVGVADRIRLVGMLVIAAKLVSLARTRRWDHLHAHSAANAAAICMFAGLLTGTPYSITLHGPIEMYGPAQNVKWENAAFGVAVTERLRREIHQAVPGLGAEKVVVAAMGVDLARFVRTTAYEPPRPGARVRLVACGRLHFGKGHQDVIRSVSLLRHEGIDASLDLLGEGPARPMLESLIGELGLSGCVTLHGAVGEEVVRARLESSSMFVLGSHDEAIGVATMEAMAMSLPVVVTRVGGVPELVRDEIDGLLVEPSNPAALAVAVQRIVNDPVLATRMGDSGCARVRERFGSQVSARAIADRLARPVSAGTGSA